MAKSAKSVPAASWKSCRASFQKARNIVAPARHPASIQFGPNVELMRSFYYIRRRVAGSRTRTCILCGSALKSGQGQEVNSASR